MSDAQFQEVEGAEEVALESMDWGIPTWAGQDEHWKAGGPGHF